MPNLSTRVPHSTFPMPEEQISGSNMDVKTEYGSEKAGLSSSLNSSDNRRNSDQQDPEVTLLADPALNHPTLDMNTLTPHLAITSSHLTNTLASNLITSVLNSTLATHVPLYQPTPSKLSPPSSNLPSSPTSTDNEVVGPEVAQNLENTGVCAGDQVLVSFDKNNAANMAFKSRSNSCKRTMRHRTRYCSFSILIFRFLLTKLLFNLLTLTQH